MLILCINIFLGQIIFGREQSGEDTVRLKVTDHKDQWNLASPFCYSIQLSQSTSPIISKLWSQLSSSKDNFICDRNGEKYIMKYDSLIGIKKDKSQFNYGRATYRTFEVPFTERKICFYCDMMVSETQILVSIIDFNINLVRLWLITINFVLYLPNN